MTGVGLAAFVDQGGAWWSDDAPRSGWDVGIGLRLGPSRAPDIEATRIDIARRFGNDAQPGGWVLVVGKGFVFSTGPRGGATIAARGPDNSGLPVVPCALALQARAAAIAAAPRVNPIGRGSVDAEGGTHRRDAGRLFADAAIPRRIEVIDSGTRRVGAFAGGGDADVHRRGQPRRHGDPDHARRQQRVRAARGQGHQGPGDGHRHGAEAVAAGELLHQVAHGGVRRRPRSAGRCRSASSRDREAGGRRAAGGAAGGVRRRRQRAAFAARIRRRRTRTRRFPSRTSSSPTRTASRTRSSPPPPAR